MGKSVYEVYCRKECRVKGLFTQFSMAAANAQRFSSATGLVTILTKTKATAFGMIPQAVAWIGSCALA